MRTPDEITRILRDEKPYLATTFGVSKIGVFGSYGRGMANESSDVDLLVEFDRPIGLKFVDLADYLENALGAEVDLLTPAGLENIRIPEIAQDIKRTLVYL